MVIQVSNCLFALLVFVNPMLIIITLYLYFKRKYINYYEPNKHNSIPFNYKYQ